jgi:hypothetical protein
MSRFFIIFVDNDRLDMSTTFFAYPLNMILALLWALSVVLLWRNCRKSRFVAFMLSKGATISSIVLFAAFSLATGLTGRREIMSSWPAVVIMLYLLTVLFFVLLRGWRTRLSSGRGKVRWRFVLNHAGLLIALSSAFWGAPDSKEYRILLKPDAKSREAISMEGNRLTLGYDIELKDFSIDTYENGMPSMYEADVLVDGKPVTLRVNHPYSVSFGEDIYLSGYHMDEMDGTMNCVLQIVREPWKYTALAGILLMIAGALLLFIQGPAGKRE